MAWLASGLAWFTRYFIQHENRASHEPPRPAELWLLLNKSEHSETTEFDPKRPFSSALHDLIASPPPSGVTESPSDIGVFGKTQSCGEL
jgi:hypothetical protein